MPYFDWNCHKLFYREKGKGSLLLVLPGNTASSICHQGELEYFSKHYRVVSLDFLGTGKSERIETWKNDWWMQGACQAESLVNNLGYKECIVMGTSGGAVVGLLMAIRFPEMVRAVIADSCVMKFAQEMLQRNVLQERQQRSPEQMKFWKFAHGDDWMQVVEADTAMIQGFATAQKHFEMGPGNPRRFYTSFSLGHLWQLIYASVIAPGPCKIALCLLR